MANKIKIEGLQAKIETMVLSLGGRPDEDKRENKYLLSQFEETQREIKSELKQAHEFLTQRAETIATFGYSSKERVVIDEDLKTKFASAEQLLVLLRDVFKKYQKKNQRRMTKFEISSRSKQIDLLRNNLNLLQSEFNNQIERNSGQTATKTKQKGKRKDKEFVDLFAINGSADNIEVEQDERALTGAERNLLKEFEEND